MARIGVLNSISYGPIIDRLDAFLDRVEEAGFFEGKNLGDRLSLRRGPAGTAVGPGRGSGQPQRERDRMSEQCEHGACRHGGDHDHADCLCNRRRSAGTRPGREPRPAGSKRDGCRPAHRRVQSGTPSGHLRTGFATRPVAFLINSDLGAGRDHQCADRADAVDRQDRFRAGSSSSISRDGKSISRSSLPSWRSRTSRRS